MAGVVADPAFFLDQVGDPRRRPQTALVAQSLRPSLEAAFDAPQVFPPQAGFASRSSGPLQPPQSAFLQLLRPATDGLSMSTDAASNFRLVYALPQQFGRFTAALFQPYEVPANSCWISHAETVAQKIRNVTILCDINRYHGVGREFDYDSNRKVPGDLATTGDCAVWKQCRLLQPGGPGD